MKLARIKPKQFRRVVNATNIVNRIYYKNFSLYCDLCDNEGMQLTDAEKLQAMTLVAITKRLAKKMNYVACDANIFFWENELQHKYN